MGEHIHGFHSWIAPFTASNDSIWVIVDRLTKIAYFVLVKTKTNAEKLADLYIEHILRLHEAPSSIVSDRGPQFVSQFWEALHKSIGTKLDFSTAYHPQTDGQTEQVNQILEDMLRASVLNYGSDWEKCFPMQSSLTTTATKPVSRCRHLKLCMADLVIHL